MDYRSKVSLPEIKKNDCGFTLVEIIVVLAIISILAGFIYNNFSNSLAKGRDSARKQDLENTSKALEMHYFDQGSYPVSIPGGGTPMVNPAVTGVVYIQKMPQDPQNPATGYCYDSSGPDYKLYTNLENLQDPEILNPTGACSGRGYNYGISSSNTNP